MSMSFHPEIVLESNTIPQAIEWCKASGGSIRYPLGMRNKSQKPILEKTAKVKGVCHLPPILT